MAEITPMMKQYLEIKEQNKDSILFFRLGDFYEMFNEDKSVYHLWDFQPTNGDRANMLKNKNEDGSVKGTSNLTPVNVPGIDNVDPENGFFVTI